MIILTSLRAVMKRSYTPPRKNTPESQFLTNQAYVVHMGGEGGRGSAKRANQRIYRTDGSFVQALEFLMK